MSKNLYQYEITLKVKAENDDAVQRWLDSLHRIAQPAVELETSYKKIPRESHFKLGPHHTAARYREQDQ